MSSPLFFFILGYVALSFGSIGFFALGLLRHYRHSSVRKAARP